MFLLITVYLPRTLLPSECQIWTALHTYTTFIFQKPTAILLLILSLFQSAKWAFPFWRRSCLLSQFQTFQATPVPQLAGYPTHSPSEWLAHIPSVLTMCTSSPPPPSLPLYPSIKLDSFAIPTSSITFNSGGVAVAASGISIHITADWSYREDSWYDLILFHRKINYMFGESWVSWYPDRICINSSHPGLISRIMDHVMCQSVLSPYR